jgi:hypothetical protein
MKYLKKFNESLSETPEFSVRLVQGEDIRMENLITSVFLGLSSR